MAKTLVKLADGISDEFDLESATWRCEVERKKGPLLKVHDRLYRLADGRYLSTTDIPLVKAMVRSMANETGLRESIDGELLTAREARGWLLERAQDVPECVAQEIEREADQRYGPGETPIIYWDREPFRVTGTTWKLLYAVWGKRSVPFEEIGEAVWNNDMTKGSTIRARVTKATAELHHHGVEIVFSCEGEKVAIEGEWPS